MKVELKPGESLKVCLEEADGEFDIGFDVNGCGKLTVEADMPDTYGRGGIIYEEKYASEIMVGDKFTLDTSDDPISTIEIQKILAGGLFQTTDGVITYPMIAGGLFQTTDGGVITYPMIAQHWKPVRGREFIDLKPVDIVPKASAQDALEKLLELAQKGGFRIFENICREGLGMDPKPEKSKRKAKR